MLVLSRKYRESVVVGGVGGCDHQLKVTVLEIAGGKVKLGFDVDPAVPVYRLEIWEGRERTFSYHGAGCQVELGRQGLQASHKNATQPAIAAAKTPGAGLQTSTRIAAPRK